MKWITWTWWGLQYVKYSKLWCQNVKCLRDIFFMVPYPAFSCEFWKINLSQHCYMLTYIQNTIRCQTPVRLVNLSLNSKLLRFGDNSQSNDYWQMTHCAVFYKNKSNQSNDKKCSSSNIEENGNNLINEKFTVPWSGLHFFQFLKSMSF